MADFDDECPKLNIPLYVLPPVTPKYNGGVEHANRMLLPKLCAPLDELVGAFYALNSEDISTANDNRLPDS